MAQQRPRTAFKGPEGRYTLAGERLTGLLSFSPHRASRLTLARLGTAAESPFYILFNVGDFVHVCQPGNTDKDPLRSIYVNAPGNSLTGMPVCHAHCFAPDGFDLLIGLSTGDVIVTSLQGQLQQPAANTKLASMLHFNADGSSDASKCTAARWVPGTDGSVFVTGHASGNVYVYHKGFTTSGPSSSNDSRFGLSKFGSGRGPATAIQTRNGGVAALDVSPDGRLVAVAGRSGELGIYEVSGGALVGGFKSYHGALLCCSWTPDGRYLAAGGEDDLVAVYGLQQGRCIGWGEAHGSWVAGVAWDPWRCPPPVTANPSIGKGSPLIGGASPLFGGGASALGGIVSAADITGAGGPMAPMPSASSATSSGGGPVSGFLYRLVSVGLDCQLALWDIDTEDELVGSVAAATPRASLDRAPLDSPGPPLWAVQGASLGAVIGLPPPEPGIAPSPPRAEMQLLTPITCHKVHMEPLSDVLCAGDALYTACQCGQVKCWRRPEQQLQQQQQSFVAPPSATAIPAAAGVALSIVQEDQQHKREPGAVAA